jgi:hypothetical protein
MNHYTVDSEFGQFIAVGNRSLKKLLHEIDAIAELRKITSLSAGTGAAVDAVADTGKSVVNLVVKPVESITGISAGVSRFFKRTSKTATNVSSEVVENVSSDDKEGDDNAVKEADEPDVTTQLTSAFLGIGTAHRRLAREYMVDPYSDNAVLQAELSRVAEIKGTVGKVSKILIPIPSIVGTAASVGDMVWNLSPMDLLIQNEEKLEALGYTDELIQAFFSNPKFSPSKQTVIVAAMEVLDQAKGREVLLQIAISTETQIESNFVVRSILLTQLYHESVEPVRELVAFPNGLVPVAITESGDGLVFAPLDHLLWTERVAAAMDSLAKLIDDHGGTKENLLWVGGRVSDLALARLRATGWIESTEGFEKLKAMTEE